MKINFKVKGSRLVKHKTAAFLKNPEAKTSPRAGTCKFQLQIRNHTSMGKNKKMKQDAGGNQHSPATVFVSNLPYTFTKSQASFHLEETFSDVGPVRRCFMVTQKGSTEHRGFAFVQFAVTEDAKSAIELKNGSSVGGRTIGVKLATHRRSKGNEVIRSDDTIKGKFDNNDIADVIKTKDDMGDSSAPLVKHKLVPDIQEKGKKGKPKKTETPLKNEHVEGDSSTPLVTHKPAHDTQEKAGKSDKPKKTEAPLKTQRIEGISSEKQRVARTVVIGGLLNDDMAEDVHSHARECGSVSSITYPLPKEEITRHGLLQDGCRLGASCIVYTSVKSARACVAKLHQKNLNGGTVWARQLGGEGSKVQKWKLIIRNLPFMANANEIKEMFSEAGLVWDVFIPKKPDSGLSKGFAFVKFTCKQDAENAIQKFNGKKFGKRPIAVDWAVPKKIYTAGSQVDLKDGEKDNSEDDFDGDVEDDHEEMDKNTQHSNKDADVPDDLDLVKEEVNFDEEADIARKVLNNFLSLNDNVAFGKQSDDDTKNVKNKICESLTKTETLTKSEKTSFKTAETEEELERTLYISNLSFDITNEEVKQRFIGFGEIQSFVPVFHQVTKRPKGTGFLKFKTADAADAAFEAATAVAGLGIILKGRQLKVLKALNKKAAHDKEEEKKKKEEIDHRNLYLAKEGLILEGTPAAEGVSENDMSKRRSLEQKKETKLKSPNFHVSKTRLIMYNVPKSMNEKQLKKVCLEAVTSRATKQKPTIRQIKLLKDSIKGKEVSKNHSRGVAFIEFTEHQHALVALRVLNNNPKTFTTEHRPIVEFALDNIQTLRQRNNKIEAQQKGFSMNAENNDIQTDFHKPIDRANDLSRKRKSQENTKDKVAEFETNPAKKKLMGSNKPLEAQHEGKESKGRHTSQPEPMDVADVPNKKRSRDQKELLKEDTGPVKRRKNKQNKEPLGLDIADKLDVLIEQYRSKFSGNQTNKSEGENQRSRRLGRWFQS
ncbi:hypothetical protein E3N88_34377 [Mikania micrantha]|uniref:RRM domain-containing protein n=1 Tax=Mikania micrantha TaxID=192012 RepID=A0A5N6LXY7_9ASTR|nr:hypothetical protein E3N88_34377 [Mikania micrantha]